MGTDRVPVLIIGAGLAGLHLAWSLHLREHPFKVLSTDKGLPAWKASAGIINPVTGKRVVKSWRIDTLLPFAVQRYEIVAQSLNQTSCYQAQKLMRYFRGDSDERERFEAHAREAAFREYLNPETVQGDSAFEIAQAGWVDVTRFVESSRTYFAKHGLLELSDSAFDPKSLDFSQSGLTWGDHLYSHIVFCEGYQGIQNPYFDWLDYRISRGDVVDFISTQELPEHILNREKWLLPLGPQNGRTGSTYTWENIEKNPDERDIKPLLQAWADKIADIEAARITEHRVGIRPGTNDSKPYAGPHPADSRICILNGFGSKGASQSPWCAEMLAGFIVQGDPLPKEITPARRLKFLKTPPLAPQDLGRQ